MPSSLRRFVAIAFVFLALGLALRSAPAMAIEEPHYTLVDQDGDFSLRKYAASIVAETQVAGTLEQASSTGFRRLAGYIFGDNHRVGVDSAHKGSTASEGPQTTMKIAMTAPVTTQQQGSGWTVNFTMPATYSLDSLPLPDDLRVEIRKKPETTVAVIRFSGWVDESKVASKTLLLKNWMAVHGLVADEGARLARYDPPWTLPFLRRNEILITCHKIG